MIGFALPWVLGAAAAGVLAILALHLLSVRRPPELLLPTARFLPERDVRAVSRTRRPSDVLLLLLRIGALIAAGLAAAVPAWQSRARERVTLVVADRWVTRDTLAMRAFLADAAASRMVFVDTHTRAVRGDDPAALLPVAWRAASQLARSEASIDSIDLHLLLSDAPGTRDAGFAAWRAAWPGRVTTHHAVSENVARRVVVLAGDSVGLRSTDDDAVRAAFVWHAARVSSAGAERADTIVLSRSDAPADGSRAAASSGVTVHWPLQGVPAGWVAAKMTADSAAALAASGRALMGPFPVTAVPPAADASTVSIAWWSDGRIAATERRTASACDRSVAVVSASASDVLLSASANALLDRLLAPCARRAPVEPSTLRMTDAKGGALADADVFRNAAGDGARANGVAWIVPLLFALSLLLLVAEWRLRTRESVSVA